MIPDADVGVPLESSFHRSKWTFWASAFALAFAFAFALVFLVEACFEIDCRQGMDDLAKVSGWSFWGDGTSLAVSSQSTTIATIM